MSRCVLCPNGKQARFVSAKVSILSPNPEFSEGKPLLRPLNLTFCQK